jgi:predicted ATPase
MADNYLLTGGPGSGKSSIILELEIRGEYTAREGAEDIIKRGQADGYEKPWEQPDFQKKILNLQLLREGRIPSKLERAFLDRGIPDGLAYAGPETPTGKLIKQNTPQYAGVFLIENLGSTDTNRVRREDQAAALEVEKKLERIYQDLGYKVHRIGPGTVNQRTDRILELIQTEHDAMNQPSRMDTIGGGR